MRIEIRCFGAYNWRWELRDSFGHPVCVCAPRTGARFYYSKATCIRSVKRFEEMLSSVSTHHFVVVLWKNGEWERLW